MNPELPWMVFTGLTVTVIVGWLLRPLVIGLGRRLKGRGVDTRVLAEIDDLRAQVRELDGGRT